LVGASVVVIVLSTFKIAMTLLDTGSAPELPPMETSADPAAPAKAPAENSARPAAPAAPSMMAPTPIGKQSNYNPAPNTLDSAQVAIPQNAVSPTNATDITGAIPKAPPSGKLVTIAIPPGEAL